ncbi:MAG: DUF1365 domain-containing protein [Verrucomicrobiae bacterium]|nr:DUF1365 domain-containing protein [Verrucomicrobiae bacterium]
MGGPGVNSGLYECEVYHERLSPKRHRFSYRLFFLDLDLDELPQLSRRLLLFSRNRFNVFTFRDSDHLDLGKADLRANLEEWLKGQGIELPEGSRIRLVTLPRIMGYIFNPVCFYFISSPNGEPLHAVVEVCNTFREVKPWLIEAPAGTTFRRTVPKHFYVSPFTSLTTQFDFRLKVPGERIEIHIDDIEDSKTTLVSWIRGTRKELTNARLFWFTVRYPALTLQVIAKIHWQALRLWAKRLPVFRKGDAPELQRDLLHPHSSLAEETNS